MLDEQLRSSIKYDGENEYVAGRLMPCVFEQTVVGDVYSSDGNEGTLKFRYIQEEEFAKILKRVKRSKKKEQEDREWLKLLNERKKSCKFHLESDESESLTSSAFGVSAQIVLQKYCDVGMNQPVSGHVRDYDALSNEAGSEAYGGTMLDISDTGNREEICTRDENVSVVQKTNTENVQMLKLLSHPKFSKHSGNMSLETIQEESVCLPGMPESFHEHHMIDKQAYNVVLSDVTKLNPCAISKESILSQRIRFIQKKINVAIDDILSLYNKIPEPDGNQDFLRRCKRAAEFSCRFSRNYLYQLRQQVFELKKQIRESTSLSTAQHTLHQLVLRKLAVAHHSALQGLQAYLHHMPSSVQCAATDKLKELLHYVCELSRLCSRVEVESTYSAFELGSDYVEKKSKALLQLVNSKNLVNKYEDGFPASHDTAVNILTTTGRKEWESSLRESEHIQVPMLSVKEQCSARKIISWKESAAKLAKEVYGSPAKKSGSAVLKRNRFTVSKVSFKDRPPVHCESVLKMSCDPASLIDMRNVSSELTGVCGKEFQNKLESVIRKAEVLQKGVQKLDGHSSAPVDDMKSVLQQQSQSQDTAQRKDEVKVTKIGPQNAQLIFLPPDPHNTLLDPADNKASKVTRPRSQDTTVSPEASDTFDHTLHCEHKSRTCCKLKSNVQIMNFVKTKTNTYHEHRPEDSPELQCFKKPSRKVSTHANIKENARRKQSESRLHSQLTLPKKDIRSAVDYRRKFHSYTKSNPMYESTVSPWLMISRLSDQLIEKILQEVARETKLESLVQNIYTLELQEEKSFSGSHH